MAERPPDGEGGKSARLAALEKRISEARDGQEPETRADKEKYSAMSLAWRITMELVMSIMIGGAMGWGLDSLFGTLPLLLIVFTLLGFAAGVRTVMRSAEEMQRKQADKPADED